MASYRVILVAGWMLVLYHHAANDTYLFQSLSLELVKHQIGHPFEDGK